MSKCQHLPFFQPSLNMSLCEAITQISPTSLFGEFVHGLVSTSCLAGTLFVLWYGKHHVHDVDEVWLGLWVVLQQHSTHTHCVCISVHLMWPLWVCHHHSLTCYLWLVWACQKPSLVVYPMETLFPCSTNHLRDCVNAPLSFMKLSCNPATSNTLCTSSLSFVCIYWMTFTMVVSVCLAFAVMTIPTWCVSVVREGNSGGVIVLEREVDGTWHWLNGWAHYWRDHHMNTICGVWYVNGKHNEWKAARHTWWFCKQVFCQLYLHNVLLHTKPYPVFPVLLQSLAVYLNIINKPHHTIV